MRILKFLKVAIPAMLIALASSTLAQNVDDTVGAGTAIVEGTINGAAAIQIDRRLSGLAEKDFSGVVLIVHGEEIWLAKGYGFADRDREVAYTVDTAFDIGSITKPFTASAIVKLQSEGKLSVRDPITKYFLGVPEDKAAITIHHLLTHTAGFKDSLGGDYDKVKQDDFVELALASALLSKPGKSYSYSNVGYSLLGIIIEKVTGTTYEQYLHARLFKPAGMMKSGYKVPNWADVKIANGYSKDKNWGTPLDHAWDEDGPYWHLRANGGLLSTASDLYRWSIALRGENILDRTAKREQFTPYVSEGLLGGGNHYGYGWSIGRTRQGNPVWEHNGSNGVFFADFRIYPEDEVVLILATNASGFRYMSELSRIAKVVFADLKK